MSFMDKMKQKAEEFDLETKAKKLQEAATDVAHQAREKAGVLATENRGKIDRVIGKASSAIDERTDGKYSDKIAKAKDQINKGVDKVAEGEHAGSETETETETSKSSAGGAVADDSGQAATASPDGSSSHPGATPSSVNPPEVSQPQAGHPAPGDVPDAAGAAHEADAAGAVPKPVRTPPKTPDQP